MSTEPWATPEMIQHTQRLLSSFQHWTGRSLLLSQPGDPARQAQALFWAPFIVVSHGTEADPIFNYGNQQALALWEFDWAEFTQLPSRASAEPTERAAREQLLAEARTQGYISNYQGIRHSRSGKRFWIEHVILWDVLTEAGHNCGQAATFPTWTLIESSS
ncbi:MEKHLA domain-containing protein [filamentous cyanobacterium LEGE 11480]|uniref:MEKHLA domain-containing protein n=1 Tax=Romeriopsis navalis LEGE 11480 TaxID=2777977 RepID=A0A928VR64_9CYAN|nr:MEKHLA domain-containing protein [Romeriopsis navalis]MBE9032273.1 MEKHLA domain-containing protein [Romeriopsis navalis LEGE 11480]